MPPHRFSEWAIARVSRAGTQFAKLAKPQISCHTDAVTVSTALPLYLLLPLTLARCAQALGGPLNPACTTWTRPPNEPVSSLHITEKKEKEERGWRRIGRATEYLIDDPGIMRMQE